MSRERSLSAIGPAALRWTPGCSGNTIGGTTADGAGNLISANRTYGIWITGAGTKGIVLEQNLHRHRHHRHRVPGNTISLCRRRFASGRSGTVVEQFAGGLTTPAGVFYGFDFASAASAADLTFRGDLSGPPQGQTSGGSDRGLPY